MNFGRRKSVLIIIITSCLFGFICFACNNYVNRMENAMTSNNFSHRDTPNTPSRTIHETDTATNEADDFMAKRLNIFQRRTENIQKRCKANDRWVTGSMSGTLYFYLPANLAYCEAPKTGCTFWKRIFRFLNHEYNGTLKSPLDISRHYVHSVPYNDTHRMSRLTIQRINLLSKDRDYIMFARNPYTRIWSAYLDKFYLPSFWMYLGSNVIEQQRHKPTERDRMCGDTVTFREFLRFVMARPTIDWHFAPVQTVCDPCSLNFAYVGKQETFANDVTYILKTHGLSSLLQLGLFNNTVVSELKSLAEDNLNLSSEFPKSKKHCYNLTLVCERLWNVYQMNGYIGEDIPFDVDILKGTTDSKNVMHQFISHVLNVYESGRQLHNTWRKQRRKNLVKAFRSLPKPLLQQFQRSYDRDFTIFGYVKRPRDIWPV